MFQDKSPMGQINESWILPKNTLKLPSEHCGLHCQELKSWNKSDTSRLTTKPDKVDSGNRELTASHVNVVQVKRKEIKESFKNLVTVSEEREVWDEAAHKNFIRISKQLKKSHEEPGSGSVLKNGSVYHFMFLKTWKHSCVSAQICSGSATLGTSTSVCVCSWLHLISQMHHSCGLYSLRNYQNSVPSLPCATDSPRVQQHAYTV